METDSRQILRNIRKKYYRYIGAGSGRIVFDLKDGTVAKIAGNSRGIAQNRAEYEISSAASSDLFAKVLYASEDFSFLIMEKADRVKSIEYVWRYFNVKNAKEFKELESIKEISSKYSLVFYDLRRAVNWGIINARPVIVDYGFTKYVKRRYY